MDIQQRWRDLWARHSQDQKLGEEILADIISKYSESKRHYHTLEHVTLMLIAFDNIKQHLDNPDEIEFAIWFHDVIYVIGAPVKKNEEDSADYAVYWLMKGNIDKKFANRVKNHIIGTNHTQKPSNKDTQYLADMDLLSLAGTEDDFNDKGKLVRAESPKSDKDYHKATSKFFQKLMERGQIYWTKEFHNKYEQSARRNMEQFIEQAPN